MNLCYKILIEEKAKEQPRPSHYLLISISESPVLIFWGRNSIHSLLLLFLGSGLDSGSGSTVELLKTLESNLSGLLRDVGQALQNFSDSVDASLEDDFGSESTAGGVLLDLADLVVGLVLLEEGNNSLNTLLLALGLGGGEAN